MLTKIKVKNFRSIRDETEIELAPITILVGGNSCGKTSVIEAIEYLRACCGLNARRITAKACDFTHRDPAQDAPTGDIDANWGHNPITCEGTFYFNNVRGHLLPANPGLWDKIDTYNFEGDISLWKIIDSLSKKELTVTFEGVGKRVMIAVNGCPFISVDSFFHSWDGKRRILNSQEHDVSHLEDSENLQGSLQIGSALEKDDFSFWYKDALDHIETPSSLMSALRAELQDKFRIFGILCAPSWGYQEGVPCNIPRVDLPIEFYSKTFDQRLFDGSFFWGDDTRIEPENTGEYEFQTYASLAQKILEPVSLIMQAVFACMEYDLNAPRVRDSRGQLRDVTVTPPIDNSESELLWNYGNSLSEPTSEHFYLARKLNRFLAGQHHLGEYQIVSAKSTEKVIRRSASLPKHLAPKETIRFCLKDAEGRIFDFSDVGSGVSFIFPIFCALGGTYCYNRTDQLVLIQQPELHLHPAAQAELGDLFIWFVENSGRLLVETHSEHLILRILKRLRLSFRKRGVKKGRISSGQVVIQSFEKKNQLTTVHKIRIGRNGEFMDPWPGGFFPEREQELFDE